MGLANFAESLGVALHPWQRRTLAALDRGEVPAPYGRRSGRHHLAVVACAYMEANGRPWDVIGPDEAYKQRVRREARELAPSGGAVMRGRLARLLLKAARRLTAAARRIDPPMGVTLGEATPSMAPTTAEVRGGKELGAWLDTLDWQEDR